MFSIFKSDPIKKLNKQYERKLEEAMHAQRNGDIKRYALLSVEAGELEHQLKELKESY